MSNSRSSLPRLLAAAAILIPVSFAAVPAAFAQSATDTTATGDAKPALHKSTHKAHATIHHSKAHTAKKAATPAS